MSSVPWYQSFFGEDYLRAYSSILTSERTVSEVEGIVKLLALPEGSEILDLCCGQGRHAIALAQHGYRVTGQDLSEFLLARGRAEAEAKRVELHWVLSDMRQIPFEQRFDAVINIFSSFGYLETEDEDQHVLEQVHRALKAGGRFLLEIIHRDWPVRHYLFSDVRRLENGLVQFDEKQWNVLTSRDEVRVTLLHTDGRRAEHHHAMRHYTARELIRMIERAGLRVDAWHGGLDGSPLTLDSQRLVILAQK